jgi:hypothetical protein
MIGYVRDRVGLFRDIVVKVITVCHDTADCLYKGGGGV